MYKYTRPTKGQVFRTRDGGTCYRLPVLDLEPKKRTIIEYVGLAIIIPLACLASSWSIMLDYTIKATSIGLQNDKIQH